MKKIPKRLFGQFVKDSAVDASTFSYRQSLENIKAGSFSLVCENSANSVVKLTVCPVFSQYIEQIAQVIPAKNVEINKKLYFSVDAEYPAVGYILPKMIQISGEEPFFKRMLSICDKLKDLGNILKVLRIFLDAPEDTWIDCLKKTILEKYAYISWHPSIRVDVFAAPKANTAYVKFSAYSQKLSALAQEMQKQFDELPFCEQKTLLQKIRLSVFVYNWLEKFNKFYLLEEFPIEQVEIMVKCLEAVHSIIQKNKSVVFDFHKGNLMIAQQGPYKGLMVLTDPLFDYSVLSNIRESSACHIL